MIAAHRLLDGFREKFCPDFPCDEEPYELNDDQRFIFSLKQIISQKGLALARQYDGDIEKALVGYGAQNSLNYGHAHLTKVEKSQAHELLGKLKDIVESSALATGKKNSVLAKIAALATEIDKDFVQSDEVMGLLGDIVVNARELAQLAQPALTEARKLVEIGMTRRAIGEGTALPPPEDTNLFQVGKGGCVFAELSALPLECLSHTHTCHPGACPRDPRYRRGRSRCVVEWSPAINAGGRITLVASTLVNPAGSSNYSSRPMPRRFAARWPNRLELREPRAARDKDLANADCRVRSS